MRPRRPDPITVTHAEYLAEPRRYGALVSAGVEVTILGPTGQPAMVMSNGGPPSRECRTCGEYVEQDDEAAEDEHAW